MAERDEDVEFRDTYVIPQQVERLQVTHVLPSDIGPTTGISEYMPWSDHENMTEKILTRIGFSLFDVREEDASEGASTASCRIGYSCCPPRDRKARLLGDGT